MVVSRTEKALEGIQRATENFNQAVQRIQKSVERLEEQAVIKASHPTFIQEVTTPTDKKVSNRTLFAGIPVEIDWISPHIHAEASIVKDSQTGRVRLTIFVEGEDAAIVESILTEDSRFIEKLMVSSVAP